MLYFLTCYNNNVNTKVPFHLREISLHSCEERLPSNVYTTDSVDHLLTSKTQLRFP